MFHSAIPCFVLPPTEDLLSVLLQVNHTGEGWQLEQCEHIPHTHESWQQRQTAEYQQAPRSAAHRKAQHRLHTRPPPLTPNSSRPPATHPQPEAELWVALEEFVPGDGLDVPGVRRRLLQPRVPPQHLCGRQRLLAPALLQLCSQEGKGGEGRGDMDATRVGMQAASGQALGGVWMPLLRPWV